MAILIILFTVFTMIPIILLPIIITIIVGTTFFKFSLKVTLLSIAFLVSVFALLLMEGGPNVTILDWQFIFLCSFTVTPGALLAFIFLRRQPKPLRSYGERKPWPELYCELDQQYLHESCK